MTLYPGNSFGLTGATPDTPDSFEIFKFVVQTVESGASSRQPVARQEAPGVDQATADARMSGLDSPSINSQFADLQNRFAGINKATSNILREISTLSSKTEARNGEITSRMATKDQVAGLETRLQRIEQTLASLQKDLQSNDYKTHFNQLHETLRTSHMSLSQGLQDSIVNGESLPTSPPIPRPPVTCSFVST